MVVVSPQRCIPMVGHFVFLFVVLTACVACTPRILPTTPVLTRQLHFGVSHPAWNPRSVTTVRDSLVSVAVLPGHDGPKISLISVFEGSVSGLGEFAWAGVSSARKVFYSSPSASWSSESILIFAHDVDRRAAVLEFSPGKSPAIVWRGFCGMNADMILDAGRDSLVLVDHRTLTTIDSDWSAEESELEFEVSRPVPFGLGFIAKYGDGIGYFFRGDLQSKSLSFHQSRVRQVAAAGAETVVLTAHWKGDRTCLEILNGVPGSRRCEYGRLPEAAWRVRSGQKVAVLWDVDGGHIFLVDCTGVRDLRWDTTTLNGMVWATTCDEGLVVSHSKGYVVLIVN